MIEPDRPQVGPTLLVLERYYGYGGVCVLGAVMSMAALSALTSGGFTWGL